MSKAMKAIETVTTAEVREDFGWVAFRSLAREQERVAMFDRWLADERLDAEEQAFEAISVAMEKRIAYYKSKGRSVEWIGGMHETKFAFNHVYGEWQMHNRRGPWAPKPA